MSNLKGFFPCVVFFLVVKSTSCFSVKIFKNGFQLQGKRTNVSDFTKKPLSISGGAIESTRQDTKLFVGNMNPAIASLVSGSIAGAIGIGVAFPLDTLKTKSQVLRQQQASVSDKGEMLRIDVSKMNMIQLISFIYKNEGIAGFFGGVKGMMIGQGMCRFFRS